MKKTILLLVLFVASLGFAQTTITPPDKSSTQTGYYRAVIETETDTVTLSNRTTERKADDDGYSYCVKRGIKTYRVVPYEYVTVNLDYEIASDVIIAPPVVIPPIVEPPSELQYLAPILESIVIEDEVCKMKITQPNNSHTPDNYDLILDGIDMGNKLNVNQLQTLITEIDATVEHCFVIEARYPDVNKFPRSNQICK